MKNLFFFIALTFLSHAIAQKKPKLVVGIVIDQMCYEYLYRYQAKFGTDGFMKLLNKGAHCRNTQYNYVPTYTGPGHASIYTGTTPNNHGIVANDWYMREKKAGNNCVDDFSETTVGSVGDEGKCSPRNLKCNTITDQLKLTYPKGKVISLSIKDRGAILPGGHLSNGSYWYDYTNGNMISSTFFMQNLPVWVSDFNKQEQAKNYLTKTWNTMLPIEQYTESEADNSIYEVPYPGTTSTVFPYDFNKICNGKPVYKIFTATPFANTFLTDFALGALKNEDLGTDQHTDFLAISYSTPDIVGHSFGPYSVELEDIYIRLDLEIARLVKDLESKVGKDNFVLFLTADHAVVPVPQYLVDKKLPGGYLFLKDKINALKKELITETGVDLLTIEDNCNIYLNRDRIDSAKLNKTAIENIVKAKILRWEGIKKVYTATELEGAHQDDDWYNMIRLGYNYNESGDVIFMLEPGYLAKEVESESARKGTSHGTAFNYDTHVPLIWYGSKIKKQEIFRKILITDISATLVHILQVQNPNCTTGQPIIEILNKK
jgi:arylsulfatase A-like enzyme